MSLITNPRDLPDLLRDSSSRGHQLNPAVARNEDSHSALLRQSESWIDLTSNPTAISRVLLTEVVVDSHAGGIAERVGAIRARRLLRPHMLLNLETRRSSADCSSQEEYDESESESDKIFTSSNEGSAAMAVPRPCIHSEEDDNEDQLDENDIPATRDLPANLQCFTPQPNLFSHPPSAQSSRDHDVVSGSYFPAIRASTRMTSSRQPTNPHQARQPQPNISQPAISPLVRPRQADHDAALRASLSTLLSCAAAARGLPQAKASSQAHTPPKPSRVEISSLRVVPEAIAYSDVRRPSPPRRTRNSRILSHEALHPVDSGDQSKRKAISRESSSDRRAAKKARHHIPDMQITPTLLTWVTAASLVVIVSALSFSTGFVLGRATGRLEASGGFPADGGGVHNCSNVAAKGMGLKRLRWSSAPSVVA